MSRIKVYKNLCILFFFCVCYAVLNASPCQAAPVITSDTKYFDVNTGCYVLEGHVYIKTGSRVITADSAQVNVASLEVWGQGNITVVQDDIHFTGQEVYVCGRNKTASISGGVDLVRDGLEISAGQVFYNWSTKWAVFKDNVHVENNGNSYTADTVNYNMATNEIN